MRFARKYDLSTLEVGQSHLFQNGNPASLKVIACRKSRRLGRKFKTSKQRNGVMVWRVA